jgi:hypothetical protein
MRRVGWAPGRRGARTRHEVRARGTRRRTSTRREHEHEEEDEHEGALLVLVIVLDFSCSRLVLVGVLAPVHVPRVSCSNDVLSLNEPGMTSETRHPSSTRRKTTSTDPKRP